MNRRTKEEIIKDINKVIVDLDRLKDASIASSIDELFYELKDLEELKS